MGNLKKSMLMATEWFHSDDKIRAYGLTFVLVALNLTGVYLLVLFNDWQKVFWNALENRSADQFQPLILKFCLIAFSFVACSVARTWFSQAAEIRWREWMTRKFTSEWISEKVLWRVSERIENPDQRCADDIRVFANLGIKLSMGLLDSTVTLLSFAGILWGLSGAFDLDSVGLTGYEIPGYMFFLAIAWAIFGSTGTLWAGKDLRRLSFEQQRREADFRNGLVRLGEYREAVSLLGKENDEASASNRKFSLLADNWLLLMKATKRLTLFTSSYSQAAVIFPILCAAPRLFSGKIAIGDVMQIAGAFGRVADSLSWLVDNYSLVAEWRACGDRLLQFREACLTARNNIGIEVKKSDNEIFHARFSINTPDGRSLVENMDVKIEKGCKVAIIGASGSGKSLSIKSLAGLWEHASGLVYLPEGKIFWLPQEPWLPYGSLKEILGLKSKTASEITELFTLVGIEDLLPDLDTTADWFKILSRGTRQKLSIIMAIASNPDWLVMDEATSSMDLESEKMVLDALEKKLPLCGMLCVAHREQAIDFCDRRYELQASR